MNEEQSKGSGSQQYLEQKFLQQPERKKNFLSSIFSTKKKQKKSKRIKSPRTLSKSPQRRRSQKLRTNSLSPLRHGGDLGLDKEILYTTELGNIVTDPRHQPQYGLYMEEPPVKMMLNHVEPDLLHEDGPNNQTYFELLKFEDWSTDLWKEFRYVPKELEDKATETMTEEECSLSSCKQKTELLVKELETKEETINCILNEGELLLEDVEKLKRHLSNYGKVPDVFNDPLKVKPVAPSEFLYLSRTCLMELGKLLIASQKHTDNEIQKLKSELSAIKSEKSDKEAKVKQLEQKLESNAVKERQEHNDLVEYQMKAKMLQEALDNGKKMMKETEKTFRGKINCLESDLASQKKANDQLNKTLQDKTQIIVCLEDNLDKLKSSLEETKQEMKDIKCSYRTKTAKLELEHSNKMALLCENQTATNKQLSQALQQSSMYASQLQEAKSVNASLVAEKNIIHEQMVILEQELLKNTERFSAMERKLVRESREVAYLTSQLEQMEVLKEQELMSIDGDTWVQLMYQQDQNILKNLEASLEEKEKNLENLRAQGDCALKEFEKAEGEVQQRRYQLNSLKEVFMDFEMKRENIVEEQRAFYSKMSILTKKTIEKDVFFKNLIQECQMKSSKINELEESLKNADKVVEEEKKNFEAQLKAMQSEMGYTLEKLVEFEKQIRLKETHLQDVIRVFEQEKKLKTTAEEMMQTYKMLLEDSKKENAQLLHRLNYFEDLEKRLMSTPKVREESKELEELKNKIKILSEDKKYLECILLESQKSKELLQKDQEDLYRKLRHALAVVLQSKGDKEALELKLNKRLQTIQQLEERQADTEDKLDVLKDVLREMKRTIDLQDQERYDLQFKLNNLPESEAEIDIHYQLKLVQKEKALLEEQFLHEKTMLLRRLRDKEESIDDQNEHLRVNQDYVRILNDELQKAREQLDHERHNHTQQMLTLQGEKKSLEMYIQELTSRFTEDSIRWTTDKVGRMNTTPKYNYPAESYHLRNRGDLKKPYHR